MSVIATLAPLGAQTIDPRGVYRVFLTDGRALPSYGEPTALAGRVAFVLVVGDPRGRFELQLISVPLAAVDARRTERYTEHLRGQQYAVTGGPTDYSAFTAEMTLTLADIEKQPDARRKLDQALQARRRVAEWPAAHRFYRVADVRTTLRGLDVIVGELARAAGVVLPALPGILEPPRYEPEVPLPSASDWVALSLAAAAASGDSDTRSAILRNALSVAGTGEAASQIRAELSGVSGQAPAAPAAQPPPKVAATPVPVPAKPAPAKPAPPPVSPPPTGAKAAARLTPAPAKTAAVNVAPPLAPRPVPAPATKAPVAGALVTAPPVAPPTVAPLPVARAPVAAPPAPVATAPASAPVPADSSSLRRPLMAVTVGVVVLAAVALAAWTIRRRPAPGLVEPPAVEAAAEIAPLPPEPLTSPAVPPVRAFVMPTSSMPQGLELVTVRDAEQHGYHAVEGEVKNVSNRVLENLEVAVRWYVSQGALLATEAAVIDAGALPAGRTVPFRVLTKSSPGMASYSLLFKSQGDVVAQFQKPGRP